MRLNTPYDTLNWHEHTIILIIKIGADERYMALENRMQKEITIAAGRLNYVKKGYINGTQCIVCEYQNLHKCKTNHRTDRQITTITKVIR